MVGISSIIKDTAFLLGCLAISGTAIYLTQTRMDRWLRMKSDYQLNNDLLDELGVIAMEGSYKQRKLARLIVFFNILANLDVRKAFEQNMLSRRQSTRLQSLVTLNFMLCSWKDFGSRGNGIMTEDNIFSFIPTVVGVLKMTLPRHPTYKDDKETRIEALSCLNAYTRIDPEYTINMLLICHIYDFFVDYDTVTDAARLTPLNVIGRGELKENHDRKLYQLMRDVSIKHFVENLGRPRLDQAWETIDEIDS
ncbi:uncharacterized protein V1518DRAFT_170135 [Limtongia smithiae]|uniref:uncharacterized protein n=1 Tax=Limtongia smithiae TaxID=1125753 RepID=UPI0034CF2257